MVCVIHVKDVAYLVYNISRDIQNIKNLSPCLKYSSHENLDIINSIFPHQNYSIRGYRIYIFNCYIYYLTYIYIEIYIDIHIQ